MKIRNDRKRLIELDAHLGRSGSACHLRDLKMVRLVEDSLRFYHGTEDDLQAWVVMPNHVHLLLETQSKPM